MVLVVSKELLLTGMVVLVLLLELLVIIIFDGIGDFAVALLVVLSLSYW